MLFSGGFLYAVLRRQIFFCGQKIFFGFRKQVGMRQQLQNTGRQDLSCGKHPPVGHRRLSLGRYRPVVQRRSVGMAADHKGGAGKDLTDISYICGNAGLSGWGKIRELINWR